QRAQDPYAAYRNRLAQGDDRRPIQNPKTLGGYPAASKQRNVYPKVKRQYGSRRARAEDLRDNQDDGSLWSGKNSESFLFVTNNIKKRGDIVIIEVLTEMKEDITAELKRTFPDRPSKKKKEGDEKEEGEDKEALQAAQAENSNEKEVHDKISTQVIESINRDYLLVRGRKEVVFKKAKRYIEIQALVSRKHITDNDTVKSDRVLEPKIRVLRY
ncbi:MAG: flagellar basal body L-ring protein FlgH, partial [Bacteriovoracaceae bacterium]